MGRLNHFLNVSILVLSICLIYPIIDNYHYNFLIKRGVFQEDILYRILGNIGNIFSDYSYINADVYYHGGIYNIGQEEDKHMEHGADNVLINNGKEYRNTHIINEKGEKTKAISKLNILAYIGEKAHISEHIHLHGDEKRELIPWLYYAVRLNPNNINAYVIGGYWIGRQLQEPNEAIKFLKEGLTNNPNSWKIYNQIGNIYFTEKEDYKQALFNFQKANKLLTDTNSDKFDQRDVYTFTAACYEKLGEINKSMEFYNKVLMLFPNSKDLKEKITSLQNI